MDRIRRDTLLGIVFFGTLGFLLWATVNLTDLSLSRELVVRLSQAGSVDVGTNVMVLGKKNGKVGAIDIDYETPDAPIVMTLLLSEDVPLKEDYLIEVRDAGVLGGKQLYIDPGRGALLPEQAELVGTVAGSAFDKIGGIADGEGALGAEAVAALASIRSFFENLNNPETSAGRLVNSRELYDSVYGVSENLNRALEAIVNAEGAVGALIMNRETRDDVTALVTNLRSVSDQLRTTNGVFGVLLNDPEAARDLQGIFENLDRMVADARAGKGPLGKLLQDEEMAADLGNAIHDLSEVFRKANDPTAGALGAITSDAQMAEDLRESMANVRHTTEQLTQSKGLLGALINDESLALRMQSILRQVSRAIEDAREAAPISNFVQVLLGTF